ncbi:hypothetical protein FACS189431_4490 [Alphaproteobacteria bacterium]|nr:hypothetical protein FACS189431_4490 [Alphaproteobacteria bacterium]
MNFEWNDRKNVENINKHGISFGRGIATVRFTIRKGNIRIIGAGYWRKGNRIYEANS